MKFLDCTIYSNFFSIFGCILHQTQEEFSLLYLAQARDAGEFPKSGNVHKPRLTRALGEGGDQVNDYPNSLDYRDKGHVTSVHELP